MKKLSKLMCGMLSLFLVLSVTVSAHSGRTDSSGGHKDNKNASGLGSYHYHCSGNPPHLHNGGGCPYAASYEVNTPVYQAETAYIPPAPTYDTITIAESTPTQLNVGQSHELGLAIDFVGSQEYIIESSDPSVISVKNNILSCVGEGTATVSVKTSNNQKSVTISVIPVPVNAIISSNIELKLHDEKQVTFKIEPKNATYTSLSFSTSDETVVQISDSGKLTGISEGSAKITLTAISGVTTSIDVNVYEIKPKNIVPNKESYEIKITEKDSFTYDILPADTQNTEHTVTIQDPNIIEISSNGTITPKTVGETSIEIKTWNGIQKTIPVNILPIPVESVLIDESEINYIKENKVDIDSAFIIKASALPEDSTYPDIVWESSNSEIISIADNIPTLVGTGKVDLIASTQDGVTSILSLEVIDNDKIIMTRVAAIGLTGALVIFLFYVVRKKLKKDNTAVS